MGLNFPNSPTVGQKHPQPAVAGVPVYLWDGIAWTTVNSATSTTALPSSTNPLMDGVAGAGTANAYTRSDHVHPTDTARAPINSAAFTGTVTATLVSVTGNMTVTGTITSTVNQHLFGYAGGTSAGGTVTSADASILFYVAGNNWSGFGADGSGNVWLRTGTSGTPAPAFWIGNDQIFRFQSAVSIPTAGAGDNSTRLANTAYVKARTPASVYPLAGGTVTGNVTINGADLWCHNNGNYGVIYLGNTGSYYLQWDGSYYRFNAAQVNASNGRLYGDGDLGIPYTDIRLAFVADATSAASEGLTEPYGGSTVTAMTGHQGGPSSGWQRRYRQLQYYTNSWFAIAYA